MAPTQVNFVGKAANVYDLGYTLHGSALVITTARGLFTADQLRALADYMDREYPRDTPK